MLIGREEIVWMKIVGALIALFFSAKEEEFVFAKR